MSEIVSQIVEATGIERGTAEKAMGMMLAFLEEEGDDAAVQKVIAAIPGAEALISEFGNEGSGGFFGTIVGGGIMGLGQKLMGLGLGMGDITALAQQTIAVARQYAGDEVVDELVASVPGLSQFV